MLPVTKPACGNTENLYSVMGMARIGVCRLSVKQDSSRPLYSFLKKQILPVSGSTYSS